MFKQVELTVEDLIIEATEIYELSGKADKVTLDGETMQALMKLLLDLYYEKEGSNGNIK